MNKQIFLVFLLALLFSCTSEEKKRPEDIWDEEKFTQALLEVQITEAVLRLGYRDRKDSIVHPDSVHAATFRKIGHNKEEFEKNFDYYIQDPAKMERIYEEVIVRLSEKEAEIRGMDADSL